MTPRPELSNAYVSIETGPQQLRVMGRPSFFSKAVIFGLFILGLTALLFVAQAQRPWARLRARGFDSRELGNLSLAAGPLVLSGVVLTLVLVRRRRPRGVQIDAGVVTVYTPDMTRGLHQFDLSQLEGARLHGVGLLIERRGHMSVQVRFDCPLNDLYNALDCINGMVIGRVPGAFEVIPVAAIVPPEGRQ